MEVNDCPEVIWQVYFHQGSAVKVGIASEAIFIRHLLPCPAAKSVSEGLTMENTPVGVGHT